jgi:hypothetical protein
MKNITKFFIIVQLLDIITTIIAILWFPQTRELNPIFYLIGGNWTVMFLCKILFTIVAAFIIEKIWTTKILWSIPIIDAIPVIITVNTLITQTINKI